MTTLNKLNSVFCEVFDDEEMKITPEMTANDVDGWDSLSHVNLIIAVETRFGVRFSQKELMTLKKVGDLVNLVDRKIGV
jgi:acyl carrier protein